MFVESLLLQLSLEGAIGTLFLALSIASVYLLVAIGLSIVFGSLKYVNMAHGVLYLAGAYIGLLISDQLTYGGVVDGELGLGLGFEAALLLVPIVVFVVGIVMERLLAKPFYERPLLDQLLVTFGVLLFFQEFFAVTFGRSSLLYPNPGWAQGAFTLPGLGVVPGMEATSTLRVFMVFATLVLVGVILAFYRYTDFGLAVRAGTEDSEMTELLGIRIGRPFLLIFAIGAAYAGLAGVLGGSPFGVNPGIGVDIIIPSLVIVIMGGVGSIRGTIVASLLAGLVYAAVTNIEPNMARASIYALAILVLTIRPNGIYPSEVIAE